MSGELRTRFAACGEVRIAYQVMGAGSIDMVLVPDGWIPMEAMLEEPSCARFVRRLASFSRLVRFDRRGTGLSDPVSTTEPPTLEQWAEDALAVLDAVGSERAAVVGLAEGGIVAAAVAAARPERISGLVFVNSTPGELVPFDDPGMVVEVHDRLEGHIQETWEGEDEEMERAIAAFAPSAVGDPRYRSWLDRSIRHAVSPSMAQALFKIFYRSDIRDILGSIRVPTLVIHRKGNTYVKPEQGIYLAEHITGARYVEVPGADHVVYLGDIEPIVTEIERFLVGGTPEETPSGSVATVLITDIVASTERAAEVGDRSWRELLDQHDLLVRRLLRRFRGREVKSTGDGVLAMFDEPSDAVGCACAIRDDVRRLGLEIRAGLHAGEVEMRGEDIAGLAVHIAARITSLAGPGEILASPVATGWNGVDLADRGEHSLKGVPGVWRLYAVRAPGPHHPASP